jgi:hypothetical protein
LKWIDNASKEPASGVPLVDALFFQNVDGNKEALTFLSAKQNKGVDGRNGAP